jgi:hypothetical protein
MMLPVAQSELLDSFIAGEGIYFETIRDYSLNLGTKVLYLERAISQNCQTFLRSLDKLYQPRLAGEAKTASIRFINALKVINDLCFNNQGKYGVFGTKAALIHYFGHLGHIVVSDFKTTIQRMITARIKALSEAHEEVTAQKQDREADEADIEPQNGWRKELDLFLAQQADIDVIQALSGVLSDEQYRSLSAEVQQVIAGNINSTRGLVQEFGASFAQIQGLTAPELQQLFDHSGDVARLVNEETHITLADLLALDQPNRAKLFKHPSAVLQLVKKVPTLFADLLKLDRRILAKLIGNLGTVAWLVNKNISFDLLSHLSISKLQTVLGHPEWEVSQIILNPPQLINNHQDPVNDPANRVNKQNDLNNLEQIVTADAGAVNRSTHNNENEALTSLSNLAAESEVIVQVERRIAELGQLRSQSESANSQKQIDKEVEKLNIFLEKFETVAKKLIEFNSVSNNPKSQTKQLTPANKERLDKQFSELRKAISELDDSLLSLPQRIVDVVVSFLGAVIGFLGGVLLGALAGTKIGVILGAPTAIVSGPVGPAITASIGTAVGAGIGGAAGAVTGWKLGHKIATYGIFKTTDNVKRSFHEFAQLARSQVDAQEREIYGNLWQRFVNRF